MIIEQDLSLFTMPQWPKTEKFFPLPLTAGIHEFALQLVVQWQGEWWNAGTAILIGDKLALSAKHVNEFIYTHILEQKIPTGIPEYERTGYPIKLPKGCGMNALQVIESGKDTLQWSVTGYYPVGYQNVDLMLLSLAPHPDESVSPRCNGYRQTALPRLWLYPPAVGQEIHAFGFPDHEKHEGGKLPNGSVKDYYLYQSTGNVIHINSTEKNRQASHVTFTTTARTYSGMSGGPVALQKSFLGNVICGVVSRGRPYVEYESLSTPLWLMLSTKVYREDEELGGPGIYTMLDLAKAGIINAPSVEHFSLRTIQKIYQEDGTFTEVVLDGEPDPGIDPKDLEVEIVCLFQELQRQGTLLGFADWVDGITINIIDLIARAATKRKSAVVLAESLNLLANPISLREIIGNLFKKLLEILKK